MFHNLEALKRTAEPLYWASTIFAPAISLEFRYLVLVFKKWKSNAPAPKLLRQSSCPKTLRCATTQRNPRPPFPKRSCSSNWKKDGDTGLAGPVQGFRAEMGTWHRGRRAHLSAGSAERKIMADLPRALSPTLSPPTSGEMITAGGLRARPAEAEMQAAGSPTRGTSALRGSRRVCDLWLGYEATRWSAR